MGEKEREQVTRRRRPVRKRRFVKNSRTLAEGTDASLLHVWDVDRPVRNGVDTTGVDVSEREIINACAVPFQ